MPQFVADYNKLLDMLTEASGGKPRFVLIGPNYHEDLGRPLPEPTEHNRVLKSYNLAIQRLAEARGAQYVNLFDSAFKQLGHWHFTDDGIELSQFGFAFAASEVLRLLGVPPSIVKIHIDAAKSAAESQASRVAEVKSIPTEIFLFVDARCHSIGPVRRRALHAGAAIRIWASRGRLPDDAAGRSTHRDCG